MVDEMEIDNVRADSVAPTLNPDPDVPMRCGGSASNAPPLYNMHTSDPTTFSNSTLFYSAPPLHPSFQALITPSHLRPSTVPHLPLFIYQYFLPPDNRGPYASSFMATANVTGPRRTYQEVVSHNEAMARQLLEMESEYALSFSYVQATVRQETDLNLPNHLEQMQISEQQLRALNKINAAMIRRAANLPKVGKPAGKKGGEEGWSVQKTVGLVAHPGKWNEVLVSVVHLHRIS